MTGSTLTAAEDVEVDVLLIGGGVAGLWALATLRQAGYKAVLLESDALGAGQTRYAQGIIHGGTKYALTGKLTASSEAVADMPARWRSCHAGEGEHDLSAATLLSDAHYLWSTNTLTSKISGFFASKVMRSRSAEVDRDSLPSLFRHPEFKGQIYRLDEPVFDTLSIVSALSAPHRAAIMSVDADSLRSVGESTIEASGADGRAYRLRYRKLILLAGEGNQGLLQRLGVSHTVMQRRPLRMVIMRGGLEDRVYAHCLGASVNPRITITSHFDSKGEVIWYMGGQLAEDGVGKDDRQLLRDTCKELRALIPWLDLAGRQLAVLDIDRAELSQAGTSRPDTFTVDEIDHGYVAWPTKLALAPGLADDLLGRIRGEFQPAADSALPAWPAPVVAAYPWDEQAGWVDVSEVLP